MFAAMLRRTGVRVSSSSFSLCMLGLLIFLTGAAIAGYGLYTFIRKRRLCTEPAEGTVTELRIRIGHKGDEVKTPVYTAEFQGMTLTLCDEVYTSFSNPKEGEICPLRINPEQPDMFYEPKRARATLGFFLVFGSIWMLVGALCLHFS